MAPPGPEEQDSLLLQRKSARRCVKQRPSYDIFEDSDDSEPGGPPAPRRRAPRENGANCLLLPLSVLRLVCGRDGALTPVFFGSGRESS